MYSLIYQTVLIQGCSTQLGTLTLLFSRVWWPYRKDKIIPEGQVLSTFLIRLQSLSESCIKLQSRVGQFDIFYYTPTIPKTIIPFFDVFSGQRIGIHEHFGILKKLYV